MLREIGTSDDEVTRLRFCQLCWYGANFCDVFNFLGSRMIRSMYIQADDGPGIP